MNTHTAKGKEALYEIMKEGKKKGIIHISFSEFKLFTECAHRHLVEKHLGLVEQPPSIHLFFGDAIHTAIEHGVEEGYGPERRADFFHKRFVKNMNDEMPDHPAEEVEQFVEQGKNILQVLDVEGIIRDYEIISVEEPLYEQVYDRFYFKGFVDLVVKHRKTGRIIIIDWKTSGQKWNMFWKKKDWAFMMQMKFYKYFWCRKNKIDLDSVDCKYIVLNRLKDKKKPEKGFGEIEEVEITSTKTEIRESMMKLGETMQKIYHEQRFEKAKFVKDQYGRLILDEEGKPTVNDKPCRFCPLKGGNHKLCNGNVFQDQNILKENNRLLKS